MFKTDFIFRQPKIEFKPISDTIMQRDSIIGGPETAIIL